MLPRTVFAAPAAALLALLSLTSAAQAGTGACPSGAVCRWEHSNYNGRQATSQIDNRDYGCPSIACGNQNRWDDGTTGLDNNVSSLNNAGARCNLGVYSGSFESGADIFCGRPGSAYQHRDPYLPNGGGYTTVSMSVVNTSNFNDIISSHDFCP